MSAKGCEELLSASFCIFSNALRYRLLDLERGCIAFDTPTPLGTATLVFTCSREIGGRDKLQALYPPALVLLSTPERHQQHLTDDHKFS